MAVALVTFVGVKGTRLLQDTIRHLAEDLNSGYRPAHRISFALVKRYLKRSPRTTTHVPKFQKIQSLVPSLIRPISHRPRTSTTKEIIFGGLGSELPMQRSRKSRPSRHHPSNLTILARPNLLEPEGQTGTAAIRFAILIRCPHCQSLGEFLPVHEHPNISSTRAQDAHHQSRNLRYPHQNRFT